MADRHTLEELNNCSREELKTFARITGHKDVHEMNVDDLCTINREISEFTDIAHA